MPHARLTASCAYSSNTSVTPAAARIASCGPCCNRHLFLLIPGREIPTGLVNAQLCAVDCFNLYHTGILLVGCTLHARVYSFFFVARCRLPFTSLHPPCWRAIFLALFSTSLVFVHFFVSLVACGVDGFSCEY